MPTRKAYAVLAVLLAVEGALVGLAATVIVPDPPEVTDGTVEAVSFRVGHPERCSLGLDTNDDGDPDVWADVDGGDRRAFCDQATRGDRVRVTDDTASFAYGATVTVTDE